MRAFERGRARCKNKYTGGFPPKERQMLGDFTYCNPTKLYFGKNASTGLKRSCPSTARTCCLCTAAAPIKKNGIYDRVMAVLNECGKTVYEDAGVMPNPTVEKTLRGRAARA